MQLQLHYTNYTTPQLQLHYITTTPAAALRHAASSSCGWGDRPGDHCNHCNHSKKHSSNHLSVHQWIRSAIRDSQQPTSPIGFLFLKLPPPPCAVLLVSLLHLIFLRHAPFWCLIFLNYIVCLPLPNSQNFRITIKNHCIFIYRRKFRSETSDTMDSWKAEVRRVRREKIRRKKMQMREKVGKSRNTVFFQWFVAPEGRKVGSLKRRVRSQLARWEMKNCTPLWREAHFQVKMYKTHQVRTTFGSCDVEKVHAVVARSTFRSQKC